MQRHGLSHGTVRVRHCLTAGGRTWDAEKAADVLEVAVHPPLRLEQANR
jgi:hypothetical protein